MPLISSLRIVVSNTRDRNSSPILYPLALWAVQKVDVSASSIRVLPATVSVLTVAGPALLPDHRRQHGVDNLNFDFDGRGVIFDGKSLAKLPLPEYGISEISTGQYVPVDGGFDNLWEGKILPPDGGSPCALLSVVPFFDEEAVIGETHRRLVATLETVPDLDFELVYVNDSSREDDPQCVR